MGSFPLLLPRPGACADWSSLPGDYEVSIKFNDFQHIPDSSFRGCSVGLLSDDARRLTVTSLQVCPGWRGMEALLPP